MRKNWRTLTLIMLLHSAKTSDPSILKTLMAGCQSRYDCSEQSLHPFNVRIAVDIFFFVLFLWKTFPFQLTPFQSMENAPEDEGYCGDGIVQISRGEECDDTNRVVTDGCVSKSTSMLDKP